MPHCVTFIDEDKKQSHIVNTRTTPHICWKHKSRCDDKKYMPHVSIAKY